MQSDLQLVDYLKKYLAGSELEGEKLRQMIVSLEVICERVTHYEETREKLRELLGKEKRVMKPANFGDMVFRPTFCQAQSKQKLNEVSILEQMLALMQY